jgi:hypothetical protein
LSVRVVGMVDSGLYGTIMVPKRHLVNLWSNISLQADRER